MQSRMARWSGFEAASFVDIVDSLILYVRAIPSAATGLTHMSRKPLQTELALHNTRH